MTNHTHRTITVVILSVLILLTFSTGSRTSETQPVSSSFDFHDPVKLISSLLEEANAFLGSLPPQALTNNGCRISLDNKIRVVQEHVRESRFVEAINKIETDILPHVDPNHTQGAGLCVSDSVAQLKLQNTLGMAYGLLKDLHGNTRSALVTPARGGNVMLEDGTTLTIPPEAVDQPVQVTVRSGGTNSPLDAGGVAWVELLPEGLHFSTPATLSIPYTLSQETDTSNIEADVFSTSLDPLLTDNELNVSRPANVLDVDTTNKLLKISLDHFSLVTVFAAKEVVITPHLPTRFLEKGDIVFTLSGGRWMPGHAGLFSGTLFRSTEIQDGFAVQSTPDHNPLTVCAQYKLLSPAFGKGVVERTMNHDFVGAGHIYMGARRPISTGLTPRDREKILTFARSQIGDCYLPVGFARGDDNYWSCTELVVGSYLSAGIGEMIPFSTKPAIWPLELYNATRPVNSITIGSEESVDIPIKIASRSGRFAPYVENPADTFLTENSGIATIDGSSRVLTIAPQANQGCTTESITLRAGNLAGAFDSFQLSVKINGFDYSQQRPTGTTLARQPEIGARVASACGIRLASAKLMLDGQVQASYNDPVGTLTSVDLSFIPPSQLSVGTHTVRVVTEDQEGARSEKSWTFEVTLPLRTLNLLLGGNGSGTVISSPSGLNCPGTCSNKFTENSNVILSASPASGSVFREWLGDCAGTANPTAITMAGDKNCTAVFVASQFRLTVSKSGSGAGTVTSAPQGINCGPVCSNTFAPDTTVFLTATGTSTSYFAGWSGDCTEFGRDSFSRAGSAAVSMTADRTCSAIMNPVSLDIANATCTIRPATATSGFFDYLVTGSVSAPNGYRIVVRTADGNILGIANVSSNSWTLPVTHGYICPFGACQASPFTFRVRASVEPGPTALFPRADTPLSPEFSCN